MAFVTLSHFGTMRKILLYASLGLVFWTCSTNIDLLDNWKETTVVYCLLDQTQPKQYVRVEKAFLGPNSAVSMAQHYDSIEYQHQLSVQLQQLHNGNVVNTWTLSPDTIQNKDNGFFYAPEEVLYSMNSPAFNLTDQYHLIVTNTQTNHTVDATTSLINGFTISNPTGPSINLIHYTSSTRIHILWNGTQNARLYQVGMTFYYNETDINNNTTLKATPEWMIGSLTTDASTATDAQDLSFDPNDFYRYVASVVSANDPNVVSRKDAYLLFTVYAGAEELATYMQVNAPSNSLVQEKPYYTNINNGLGLFSSRYSKSTPNLTLSGTTEDSLSMGQFTCHLRFMNRNNVVAGCQ